MRKLLFLIFVILVPGLIWGQVKVANATRGVIQVDGISVPSRNVKDINLSVNNDVASLEVSYYEGQEKRGPITIYRELEKGQVVIRDYEVFEDLASRFNQKNMTKSEARSNFQAETRNLALASSSGDWWSTTTVSPKNMSDKFSIFVPVDPFKGLALKPGQESARSATLRTGKIMFPVLLGSEDSSTKTGMSFSWALVNKIVTEGQDILEIRDDDVMMANSGEVVRKNIISKFPFDFIISEGASRGVVVASNYLERLDLYLGWNIIPIQYKDANGLPTEAILILLVNDQKKPLLARKKGGNDEISFDAEDIVVTNYGR